jgi:hypothetical protein
MATQWVITLAKRSYKIELEHNVWTNVQKVSIDGLVIFKSPPKLYMGSVVYFTLEGERCAIVLSNKLGGFLVRTGDE